VAGLIAAAGAVLIVAGPTAATSIAGWGLYGLGLAAIAPTVLGAAPSASPAPPPVSIAAVTTIGYLGSFTGPPLIGAVAGGTGLSTALGLLLVSVAVAIVLLAGRALRPR
jgi:hypothetical protein